MRYLLVVIILSFFGTTLKAQKAKTFIRKITSEYNGYSLKPNYLHQTNDSNYLTIMAQQIMGNTAPVYIRYNQFGIPTKIGGLEATAENGSANILFTKTDGLFYNGGGSSFSSMILYDSAMTRIWRKDISSDGVIYPKGEYINEVLELDSKLVGIGLDSIGPVMIIVDMKTGITVSTVSLLGSCVPCIKTAYSGEINIIGNRIYFGTRDEISSDYSSWKMYSGSVDTLLKKFNFTSINHLADSGKGYTLWPYQHSVNSAIVFEDTLKKNEKFYSAFDSSFSKLNRTEYISQLGFEGVLVKNSHTYKNAQGIYYYHYIVDRGKSVNPRNVDVIFKIDSTGKLLKEYVLEYVKNGEVKSEYWIHGLKPTKQGGFAFFMRNPGLGSQYLFVVTDSNLNVNGKPFYSDYISDDTLGISDDIDLSELKVFPNPTNSVINISMDNQGSFIFHLRTVNGQIVNRGQFETNTQIDVSLFPKGIYFLQIQGEGILETRKIIISH